MSFKTVKRGYPTKFKLQQRYNTEYKAALEKIGTDHVNVRDQVTAGWDNETPLFKKQVGPRGRGKWRLLVLLTGDKKGMLKWRAIHGGEGWKSSWTIAARRRPRLHFQIEFDPKTTHRTLKSREGGKHGPYRHPQSVRHFGFENRELDEEANRILLPQALKDLDAATKKANS